MGKTLAGFKPNCFRILSYPLVCAIYSVGGEDSCVEKEYAILGVGIRLGDFRRKRHFKFSYPSVSLPFCNGSLGLVPAH